MDQLAACCDEVADGQVIHLAEAIPLTRVRASMAIARCVDAAPMTTTSYTGCCSDMSVMARLLESSVRKAEHLKDGGNDSISTPQPARCQVHAGSVLRVQVQMVEAGRVCRGQRGPWA